MSLRQRGKTVNVALALANAPYPVVLPMACTRFEFRCRTNNELHVAFDPVAALYEYETIPPGSQFYEEGIGPKEELTLYFVSPDGGVVLEGLYWEAV